MTTQAFGAVRATPDEISAPRAGDDLVAHAVVVMDRAFTVQAPPAEVWPWLQQLGKGRAGWYFPRSVERLIPPARRALRSLDDTWQHLQIGDVIPDYGGPNETFEVAMLQSPTTLVYRSRRRRTNVSWSITLTPCETTSPQTRVQLRLRLAPVRRKWLANSVGDLFDLLTIAGMAAGLRERLAAPKPPT